MLQNKLIMKKEKICSAEYEFFIPGLEAMVRDGVFPDIEFAKNHLTKLKIKFLSNKKK